MHVIVTGGTGFIGRALVAHLVAAGHEVTVIDRTIKQTPFAVKGHRADLTCDRLKPEWFEGADAIVHLAGVPIAGRWWTAAYRREIIASRVTSAERILQQVARLPRQRQPRVIVSASAIGIYGDQGDEVLGEWSLQGRDFLAFVCKQWEAAWAPAEAYARVVHVRTAIVVDKQGGLMTRLQSPARWGVLPVLGSGLQWMTWVSLHDLVRIYTTALEDDTLSGPLNAASPRPLRGKDFMQVVAGSYGTRARLRLPAWLLRLALGGASELVLASQRVKPSRLLAAGFRFDDETLKHALAR